MVIKPTSTVTFCKNDQYEEYKENEPVELQSLGPVYFQIQIKPNPVQNYNLYLSKLQFIEVGRENVPFNLTTGESDPNIYIHQLTKDSTDTQKYKMNMTSLKMG